MTPMDFLLQSIGSNPLFMHFKTGFYQSDAILHFLNIIQWHAEGSNKLLTWIKSRGVDMITKAIEKEVDCAKDEFTIALHEVTPEVLLSVDVEYSVTAFLKDKAPLLWKVLVSSSHTARALAENTVKRPDLVSY